MLLVFWEEKLNTQLSLKDYQKYFDKFWGEIKQVLSRGMSSNILRCFLKRLTQAGDKRAQFQTKYMTNDFRQMQIRICGQIYVYF